MASRQSSFLDKIKQTDLEKSKMTETILAVKKKKEELDRRILELKGSLSNRQSQLEVLQKRCEESKLQLTELASNEKRVDAIHEIEHIRHEKLRCLVQEHKAAIDRLTSKNKDQFRNRITCPNVASPYQLSAASYTREYQLDEREGTLNELQRSLEKREQNLVIKKNHNTARIVRLRKLLQTNETKRATCKEQLVALKSRNTRRY
ncbi:uncharacterized protein LOC129756545 [Uranotaenia lowii]|uniref:uncharacterized protein LOC129756545 n=1 Tax=Uranotaenia lowii TaxID=190385 RepID=UPI00247895BA|nr:uncharacterized protein LOC129756545 [Uranotaenia lowii]